MLASFAGVAGEVSTPVLLQAWGHFTHRPGLTSRAFFPKGQAAKVQLEDGPPPPLDSALSARAAALLRETLVARFAELPPLGRVYVDPELANHFVPFSQRSAGRTLRPITRGSRFDLPPGEGNTLRFFCWWRNMPGKTHASRVDIDLSVTMFRDDWSLAGEVAFYNLRAKEGHHSGDITSAPEGACEFIDVSIPAMQNRKVRYVVPSLLSYTGQPFAEVRECSGGWMRRKRPNSGEVFEPRTVIDKIDVTAPGRACVPVIFDLADRKAVWCDMGLKTAAQMTTASENRVGFTRIGRAITDLKKPTLRDLFAMHAEARGGPADTPEEADTVFGVREGTVTAFDEDTVLSEYLA